eukprot:3365434-Prymnesium_polylepis.2
MRHVSAYMHATRARLLRLGHATAVLTIAVGAGAPCAGGREAQVSDHARGALAQPAAVTAVTAVTCRRVAAARRWRR